MGLFDQMPVQGHINSKQKKITNNLPVCACGGAGVGEEIETGWKGKTS